MTPEEAIAFAVFKDNTKKLLIDSVARQELLSEHCLVLYKALDGICDILDDKEDKSEDEEEIYEIIHQALDELDEIKRKHEINKDSESYLTKLGMV